MSKAKGGNTKAKYKEGEPDLTETGIGKNYRGYRIFHTRKKDRVERIGNDYSLGAPSEAELSQFMRDLARAAPRDKKIARYLQDFPSLRERALPEAFKPQPEPPMDAGAEQSGTIQFEDAGKAAASEK